MRQALEGAWRYLPTARDRNAVGLRLVGAQPGLLPGEEGAVARAWRSSHIAVNDGIPAPSLIEAIEDGRIKGLVCIGADALSNFGDDDRTVRALARLQFFVLTDLFDSPFAQKAHVFIGAASNLEREGTYCDIQGNLARLVAAEPPFGGAHADWETLAALIRALGVEVGARYASAQDVFDEMIRLLAPGFQGSFRGLELPGPANDHSVQDPGGARRMTPEYNPGDYRTDGAHFRFPIGEIISGETLAAPQHAFEGEGLILTFSTNVRGADYHLERASIAHLLRTQPYAEFNLADAARLGIEENQLVAISLPDGTSWEAAARVRLGGPSAGSIHVPSSAIGVDLRTLGATVRVRVEPLAERGAEQELIPAAVTN